MYIRKVKVKGKTYYQEVEAYWEDGKKKLRVLRHLGANPSRGSALGTNTGGRVVVGEVRVVGEVGAVGAVTAPFPVLGAVQIPFTIPLGEVVPTPPYTIREYALSESLAARAGLRGDRVKCWRILGTNGAWWPTAQNPTNFLEFDDAQRQLRQLWRKGG